MSKQSINRPQLACGKSQAQLMSRSHTDDCADRERIPVTSRLPFHTTIRCLTSAEMGARREERKGWDRGAGGLSWGVRNNRFELQLVDPGRPGDFVIKFHGRLADHVDPEKPGLRRNYNIVINA